MPRTVVNLLFHISIDNILLDGSVEDCGYVLVENKTHAIVMECADGQRGSSIKTIISYSYVIVNKCEDSDCSKNA